MPRFRPNVALLLLDQGGRLLVCERLKIADSWQFPQGGVDPGEDLREALLREVEEEIGLPPESYEILESRGGYRYFYPDGVKKRKKGNFDGQEQTYFLCRLGPDAPPIDLDAQIREFRDFKWIEPGEFSAAWLPEFKLDVYRAVMRDFFAVEI
jgi:putative (di)nucleoside polyphosphate hydrolase